MELLKFDEEENLGGVIAKKNLIARIVEFKPDMDKELFMDTLRKCCNVKLGFTCGFMFESNRSDQLFKNFLIIYAPKIKNALMRQEVRGYSCWYAWQYVDSANVRIMSKDDMLKEYDFDLDLFFESDYFMKSVQTMKKTVGKMLQTVIVPYIDKNFPKIQRNVGGFVKEHTLENKEAMKYVETINKAMLDIDKVTEITVDDNNIEHRSHTKDTETFKNRDFDKDKKNKQIRKDINDYVASRKAGSDEGDSVAV